MDTKESGILSNKCRGNDEIRKLSFGEHHNYNWFIQETSMDAKTGRWELQDKFNCKVSPHQVIINYKKEHSNLIVE